MSEKQSHDYHVVLTETVVKGFTSCSWLWPTVFSWLTLCAEEWRGEERRGEERRGEERNDTIASSHFTCVRHVCETNLQLCKQARA